MSGREVAVLGLGSIGLRHAGNAIRLDARVVGFDPDAARRALLKDLGGTPVDSREVAIDTVGAVVVASPNRFHHEDMKAAISAGRHVFAEKPLAHLTAGVSQTLDAADSGKLVVQVGQNIRYHPAVRRARRLLDEGALGQILWARLVFASHLPSWRAGQDYRTGYTNDPVTGGVIFDMVHEIDLAAHLLGPFQAAAATARRSPEIEIASESSAALILQHEGGAFSSLMLDYGTSPTVRTTQIAGTEGVLDLDLEVRRIRLTDAAGASVLDEHFSGGYADDYVDELANFFASIDGTETPLCDGREALTILEQVLKARELAGLENPR